MRRLLSRILIALVVVVVLATATVYVLSSRRLQQRYAVADEAPLVIGDDSGTVERGRHLFLATAACAACHGVSADGGLSATSNPVFVMSPPNLTRGVGGVGATLSPRDWERAIRHGVRADSTSLMVMPSNAYAHLSDADVSALIAYLRQVPPVDRTPLPTGVGPIGRALLAAGLLAVQVAPRVEPHAGGTVSMVEQGRYLANISGCHGCHNPALSGGSVPGEPPDLPPARNITPAAIGQWSEADFVLAVREGKRPDGTQLQGFMPWERYSGMTDEEVHALWEYVRSVPAVETQKE